MYRKLIITGLCALTFSAQIAAQSEEELDRLLLEDNDVHVEDEGSFVKNNAFSFSGFAQLKSAASIYQGGAEDVRFHTFSGRIKINPEYVQGSTRGYADIDFFTNTGMDSEAYTNNVLDCVEAYIESGTSLRWKVGKQRFNWGSGDVFQPTNIIDRQDLRESFMQDSDNRYTGAYAMSLKYLAGDLACESVIRPVSQTPLAPSGFYAPTEQILSTPSGEIQSCFEDSQTSEKLTDISAALRFGGTSGGLDWHLLAYSGTNNNLLYSSALERKDSSILLSQKPVLRRITLFGGDFAYAYDKVNTRFEFAYSPDMCAVSEITEEKKVQAFEKIASGSDFAEVQKVTTRQYISYSAGCDYNLWGDYGTIYAEWMQARYLKVDDVATMLQSDLLVLRAEDSFLDQSVNVLFGAIFATRGEGPGIAANAEAEYDFKNGLTAACGVFRFYPNDNDYIAMFEDKDMIYLNMKYLF